MDVLGKPEVVKALREAGREGQTMARRIQRAGPVASRGLIAVDRAATVLDTRMRALAASTGSAGVVLEGFGSRGLKAAAAIGAIVLGTGAVIRGARNAAQTIAGIGDQADRIGISADAFEKITAATVNFGQKTDGLEASLSKYIRTLAEARAGNKQAQETFQAIGIDVVALTEAGESNEDILLRVADAFAAIKDPAERARIGQRLFEEGGRALVPVLAQGSAALREQFAEAERLGQLYGGEVIASAQAVNAELDRQSQIISVQLNKAFIELAPAIQAVTGVLPDVIRLTKEYFGVIVDGIQFALSPMIEALEQLELLWGRVDRASSAGLRASLDALNEQIELARRAQELRAGFDPTQLDPDTQLLIADEAKTLADLIARRDRIAAELVTREERARAQAQADAASPRRVRQPLAPPPSPPPPPSSPGRGRPSRADQETERLLRERQRIEAQILKEVEQTLREQDRLDEQLREEQQRQIEAFREMRERGVEEGLTALAEFAFGLRSGTDILRSILSDLATDLPAILFGGQTKTGFGSLLQGLVGGVSEGLFSSGGISSFLGDLFGFAHGGSFEVSPSTAVASLPARGGDNRLIAFRAQDGERVTVTPRGRSAGGMQQVFNIVVEGDATDATIERLRRVARDEIGQARPAIISDSVIATGRELDRNPDFLR